MRLFFFPNTVNIQENNSSVHEFGRGGSINEIFNNYVINILLFFFCLFVLFCFVLFCYSQVSAFKPSFEVGASSQLSLSSLSKQG